MDELGSASLHLGRPHWAGSLSLSGSRLSWCPLDWVLGSRFYGWISSQAPWVPAGQGLRRPLTW